MKTDIKIKSHNFFPMYIAMFVYNGVILIMMTMKLQYHQVLLLYVYDRHMSGDQCRSAHYCKA